jgi:hypothetical protein
MGVDVKTVDKTQVVKVATEKAAFTSFRHAAGGISKYAKASIIREKETASAPGKPPHTRGKPYQNLRAAIRFHATKTDAIVGPVGSYMDELGRLHEFGGRRGDAYYPPRPFMQPALEANLARFAQQWAGSIS